MNAVDCEIRCADRNKSIFKIVEKMSDGIYRPYYYFNKGIEQYEVGKEYEVKLGSRNFDGKDYSVDEGIHCYSIAKCCAVKSCHNFISVVRTDGDSDYVHTFFKDAKNVEVLEGVIPKGSMYYENSDGEIVSERIRFTGIMAMD